MAAFATATRNVYSQVGVISSSQIGVGVVLIPVRTVGLSSLVLHHYHAADEVVSKMPPNFVATIPVVR